MKHHERAIAEHLQVRLERARTGIECHLVALERILGAEQLRARMPDRDGKGDTLECGMLAEVRRRRLAL